VPGSWARAARAKKGSLGGVKKLSRSTRGGFFDMKGKAGEPI